MAKKKKNDDEDSLHTMLDVKTFEMAAVPAGANGSKQWLVLKEHTMPNSFKLEQVEKAADALSRVVTVLKSGKVSKNVQKSLDASVSEVLADLTDGHPELQMSQDVLDLLKTKSESISEAIKSLEDNQDIRTMGTIETLQADIAALSASIGEISLIDPVDASAADTSSSDTSAADTSSADAGSNEDSAGSDAGEADSGSDDADTDSVDTDSVDTDSVDTDSVDTDSVDTNSDAAATDSASDAGSSDSAEVITKAMGAIIESAVQKGIASGMQAIVQKSGFQAAPWGFSGVPAEAAGNGTVTQDDDDDDTDTDLGPDYNPSLDLNPQG